MDHEKYTALCFAPYGANNDRVWLFRRAFPRLFAAYNLSRCRAIHRLNRIWRSLPNKRNGL